MGFRICIKVKMKRGPHAYCQCCLPLFAFSFRINSLNVCVITVAYGIQSKTSNLQYEQHSESTLKIF